MVLRRAQSFYSLALSKEVSYMVCELTGRLYHQSLSQMSLEGVNTGFGGSADTRTKEIEELQATLIRELHSGILVNPNTKAGPKSGDERTTFLPGLRALLCEDPLSNTCMPEAWARASILIRINSLASGQSGVRPILINNMTELLRKNIIPRIPLRGSISASGDLMPLSYIGGTLEGKRSLTVWTGSESDRRIVTADVALRESSLDPIKLGPKEGLAIINGTAVSTGVAALAMHDANNIAVLSQVLTAMSVEALRGTDESFDPFFAAVRPHPGQIEAARNVRSFLTESKLVQHNDGSKAGTLRQDRYSIRTAPQWLGPVLEDLQLASRQITIECNSVTDNPLIDINPEHTGGARILHGGNFQAKVTTSAMEKVRLGVQTIGQMLFAQCTEIINPRLNYGLPPSLVIDEPSQSFLLKPLDIMIAALQSELGFLSNPAGTYVQSAEMGNQALNSLGLISARYTHTALDVLSQLAAAHLFAVCQALDLRAMHSRFLKDVEPMLRTKTFEILADVLYGNAAFNKGHGILASHRPLKRSHDKIGADDEPISRNGRNENDPQSSVPSMATADPSTLSMIESLNDALAPTLPPAASHEKRRKLSERKLDGVALASSSDSVGPLEHLHSLLWKEFTKQLDQTTTLDSTQRFITIFRSIQPIILDFASSTDTVSAVKSWTKLCSNSALEIYNRNRDSYHTSPDASPLLGTASRRIYKFVREELKVPFLRTSMLRDQGSGKSSSNGACTRIDIDTRVNAADEAMPSLTTGKLITTIYEAIRSGELYGPVMECLAEAERLAEMGRRCGKSVQ